MMINLKSLRKIVDYDMVKHIGLVIDGSLVSVYPEKYELFNEMASKVYLTHLKIMRNSKNSNLPVKFKSDASTTFKQRREHRACY